MKRIVFIVIFATFWLAGMAQEKATLRLNPEKNKVYRLISTSEQTTSQTVQGMAQNVESKTRYVISLKMMDATPDFLVTEIRFDTIDTRTNAMGKTTVISSASEGDVTSQETSGLLSYFMNRLSKNALFVKIDYSGHVVDIVNAKMLSDIILKDTASVTLTGMMGDAMKGQIANMVSVASLSNMIEAVTWNLPGREVNKGDNWQIIQKMNTGGMALDIVTNSRLDNVKEQTASITAQSDIKAAANAAPIRSGGATVSYDDLQGMSKTTLLIDIRTGLPLESSVKTSISGNLGVSAPGVSMQIPMSINGETKVKAL
jgi:hypothetical protein